MLDSLYINLYDIHIIMLAMINRYYFDDHMMILCEPVITATVIDAYNSSIE